jgi:hypothetical protein
MIISENLAALTLNFLGLFWRTSFWRILLLFAVIWSLILEDIICIDVEFGILTAPLIFLISYAALHDGMFCSIIDVLWKPALFLRVSNFYWFIPYTPLHCGINVCVILLNIFNAWKDVEGWILIFLLLCQMFFLFVKTALV